MFLRKNYVLHGEKLVKCHGRNHFSVKCKKVNMGERDLYDESSDEELSLNVVNSLNCNNYSLSTVINENNCYERFQLDSGAQNQYHLKVRQWSSTLRVYDLAPSKTSGEVDLCVTRNLTK